MTKTFTQIIPGGYKKSALWLASVRILAARRIPGNRADFLRPIGITSCFLLFVSSFICHAQDTQPPARKYPSAVLVQLRSEHNRIQALTKSRRFKDVEAVKIDANGAALKMIADFEDNFKYCPVYYYIDTNLELVKKRAFQNVLLDSSRNPVGNLVISDTSTDYYIVFYGYPILQPKRTPVITDSMALTENHERTYKGLVVNNYKFQQVSYVAKPAYRNIAFQQKGDLRYNYSSKRFDIDYLPYATDLNKALVTHAPGHKQGKKKE